MKFELQHTDSKSNARAGLITTDHGTIQTPIFMPVGTVGSVKAVQIYELKNDIEAQIILGNTYHLYLRPGIDILEKAGGLHKFNGFDRPMLTDSGGFQVFSLTGIRKLTEEGVEFRSHIDGSKHMFTPERVMDIERSIGADIIMAFDECAPGTSDYEYARKSTALTHRWLDRCIERFDHTEPKYGYKQSLFPIVQGCIYRDLRIQSAEYIAAKGADGNAIGGLAVGEPVEKMYEMIELVNGILPKDKPRYLMGVGTPANILEGISLGVDMFDCVMPTRNGRNGMGRIGDFDVSPDGKKIVYTVAYYSVPQNKSNREVFVMNADGTDNRQITHTPYQENNVKWIKGGSKLAFLSNDDGSSQLYEMNADGSSRTKLSAYDGDLEGFKFSPDEKKILFIAQVKTVKSTADKYPDLPKASGIIVKDLMYKHWDEWITTAPHPFVADFDGNSLTNVSDIMVSTIPAIIISLHLILVRTIK